MTDMNRRNVCKVLGIAIVGSASTGSVLARPSLSDSGGEEELTPILEQVYNEYGNPKSSEIKKISERNGLYKIILTLNTTKRIGFNLNVNSNGRQIITPATPEWNDEIRGTISNLDEYSVRIDTESLRDELKEKSEHLQEEMSESVEKAWEERI